MSDEKQEKKESKRCVQTIPSIEKLEKPNETDSSRSVKNINIQCQNTTEGGFGNRCRSHSWPILKGFSLISPENVPTHYNKGEPLPEWVTDKERKKLFLEGNIGMVNDDGDIIKREDFKELDDRDIAEYARIGMNNPADVITLIRDTYYTRKTLLKLQGAVKDLSVQSIIKAKLANI